MGKAAYIGVSGTARKVKKAYIGVDGKARKIKKMYIGDANGKARLCWSGHTSKFACAVDDGYIFSSENNLSWAKSASFSDTILASGSTYGGIHHGVVCGNGIYVVAHGDYTGDKTLAVSYSEDAITWTNVVVDSSLKVDMYSMKLDFCNGRFILMACKYASSSSYAYTSVDGKTWTKVGYINPVSTQTSGYGAIATDIVYAKIDGVYRYVCFMTIAEARQKVLCYSSDLLTWTKTTYMISGHNNGDNAVYALYVINDVLYALTRPNVQYSTMRLVNVIAGNVIWSLSSYYYYFGGSCVDYDKGEIIFVAADGSGYNSDYDYFVTDLSTVKQYASSFGYYVDWSAPGYGNGKVVQLLNDGNSTSAHLCVGYREPRGTWTYAQIAGFSGMLYRTRMAFLRD